MFPKLDIRECIILTTNAKLRTVFSEVFDQHSRVTNPAHGDENLFAFDSLRLLEGVSETWRELYDALAYSCEEPLKENYLLLEEKNNPGSDVDSRLQKVHGKLAFKKSQFSQLQDQYSERGIKLTQMEE